MNGFSDGQYVDRYELRNYLYEQDQVTMGGIATINTFPAADVVARDCYNRLLAENDELRKERPVVRCGECKHRGSGNQNCVGRSKDWFCPLGEREDKVNG